MKTKLREDKEGKRSTTKYIYIITIITSILHSIYNVRYH